MEGATPLNNVKWERLVLRLLVVLAFSVLVWLFVAAYLVLKMKYRCPIWNNRISYNIQTLLQNIQYWHPRVMFYDNFKISFLSCVEYLSDAP